jgi:hypothetical protein
MNSLVYLDNNESLNSNELQALNGLYGLLEQAEQQMADRAEQTHQKSLQTFLAMKSHVDNLLLQTDTLNAQLIEYESEKKQMTIAHQGEVAAWQSKAEQAERALDALRQKMAEHEQKAHAQLEEAIKAKDEAVRIAVQVGDARIAAIKQQITVSLDNMYLTGGNFYKISPIESHKVGEREIRLMLAATPRCSCHHPDDPNGYTQSILSKYPSWPAYDKQAYLDRVTVHGLANILVQQIETLKKIAA